MLFSSCQCTDIISVSLRKPVQPTAGRRSTNILYQCQMEHRCRCLQWGTLHRLQQLWHLDVCSYESWWEKKNKANNSDFTEFCLCSFQAFRTNNPERETLLFMNSSQASQSTSFNTACSPLPHGGEKITTVQQYLNICILKHSDFLSLL